MTKISNIVERIAAIAEQATLANRGRETTRDNQVFYVINTDF